MATEDTNIDIDAALTTLEEQANIELQKQYDETTRRFKTLPPDRQRKEKTDIHKMNLHSLEAMALLSGVDESTDDQPLEATVEAYLDMAFALGKECIDKVVNWIREKCDNPEPKKHYQELIDKTVDGEYLDLISELEGYRIQ
jgi:hypothetical protein